MSSLPSYRARFLQLTAVWAYGVSQPVFALIDGNPDLLVTHGLTRAQVAVFALLVALVPPALAVGYVWLAARVSPWAADRLFLVLLGACLVPVVSRAVKHVDAGLVLAAVAVVVLAVAAVVVYVRSKAARLFLAYSIVLPAASLVWFVHGLPPLTEDAEAADIRVASPAPVVFIVLDELPASSLMTRDGEIDAVRYPSFARLAREGTWYPNATTVHEWTSDAVPSLLTGRIGRASTLPTIGHYPENLFTLLGDAYRLHVNEYATQLCPEAYCQTERGSTLERGFDLFVDSLRVLVTRNLPEAVSGQIVQVNYDIALEGDSTETLDSFDGLLSTIRPSSAQGARSLYYHHLLLPHAPFRFLPSGAQYDFKGMDGWLPTEHWENEPWLTLQSYQRHLLQVGYTDRVLGRLLRRLDRQRVYDDSLVVVVGDHGTSFRAGEGRRPLTDDNLADIANVPLFVKYPRQEHGGVDSRPARSVDVLPTIADVLGVRIPWRVEGTSLLAAPSAERGVFVDLRGGGTRRATLDELVRDRATTLAQKAEAFGAGRDSLYRIGTNRSLLGRDVADLRVTTSDVRVRIENEAALRQVRRSSGYVPTRILGRVVSGRIEPGDELAIAVNGRIEALTRAFGDRTQRFRALVPEISLRNGANRVEVVLVRRGASSLSLASAS